MNRQEFESRLTAEDAQQLERNRGGRPAVTLAKGCPGCNRVWGASGSEGQCSRCKRCLSCCDLPYVHGSCAAKFAAKTLGQQARSRKAYERWEANPNMLKGSRRIG